MIRRFVKMKFRLEEVENFKSLFAGKKEAIGGFPGCHYVELLEDKGNLGTFFTLSVWEDEDSLQRYRQSTLFQETWAETKALFDGKPEAWTLSSVENKGLWVM